MFPRSTNECPGSATRREYFCAALQSSAFSIRHSRQQINDPRKRWDDPSPTPDANCPNLMTASQLIAHAGRGYGLLARCASVLACPLLLAVRVYWGWQFFGTGRAKLGDIPAFTERFANWGIPFPQLNVILAGSTEAVCGLLLLAGLASRLISIPLIFTMLVAYLTAESEALHAFFSDPDKFVSAAPFQFMFAAILVLIFGPGVFSLDWIIGKIYAKRAAAAASQKPAI